MRWHWSTLRHGGAAFIVLAVLLGAGVFALGGVVLTGAAQAQASGEVPGQVLGNTSDSELWRAIRRGEKFTVSIPDANAAILVQSEGDNWRAIRNGPLSVWSSWAMAAMIVVLALFFFIRGRVRIEPGPAGHTIERFNGLERFTHWLMAISFIILALTGLNIMFGRYLFGGRPALEAGGAEFGGLHNLFATLTYWGKFVHNFTAFAFMIGIVLAVVLWIAHNIPNRHDFVWLAKGGGILVKGVHPPAKRFNAGQKLMFWAVVLGGLSLSLSGISLMFPFEFAFFDVTFRILNVLGLGLPTDLSPIQEMQFNQVWHAIVAIVMIMVIFGHIYIGSVGMEGAFWAMGTGQVDENWAREHHSLWAEEVLGPKGAAERAPAGGDD